jgi:L-threonylcarbamoyladenylate synthase
VTEVLRVDPTHPDPALIGRAAECLRCGGLVAFPTETVYGLGAHALDRQAVHRVFVAKERPANDPLIVHVAAFADVAPLVAAVPDAARQLAGRFWPGPLTIVLKRSDQVPDEVTAGLQTVAIRVPSHPVARALIEAAQVPVAAPSANLFSRPSPTIAWHVLADLEGRIDMLIDAGPTHVGLESTVLDLSADVPTVLRPGAIDIATLRELLPNVRMHRSGAVTHAAMPSPGMLVKHYAPRTPVILHAGDRAAALRAMKHDAEQRLERDETVAVLAYVEDLQEWRTLPVRVVDFGREADPRGVAARLYAALRECDELNASVILVRSITTVHPLSSAIHDRLRRAAAR